MSSTIENPSISPMSKLDALWTLFCSQPKSVRNAFAKRLKEQQAAEKSAKVKMTEKEFYAKLDRSIASTSKGPIYTMGEDESGAQFLDRILKEK